MLTPVLNYEMPSALVELKELLKKVVMSGGGCRCGSAGHSGDTCKCSSNKNFIGKCECGPHSNSF